ncbi:hypothetical protein J2128_000736 [Methanomicrobium sp. W14]|uniref:hypothetical protein n=1 Tax=Methanomicrobium sp. W14 TaxID=2817839 RepID=UPI001AE7CAF6|nr:hypothetical protein [Methanomicrobium sp. W14]MBP2132815.1 hypothetical protein [Methanomicrobium sp. W14]
MAKENEKNLKELRTGLFKISTEKLYLTDSEDFTPKYENIIYSNGSSTLNTGNDFFIDFLTLPGIVVNGERIVSVNRIMMNSENAKILAEQILNNLKINNLKRLQENDTSLNK